MAEWKQHVKKDDDGKELWDKGCTGKLIRKYQDKEAYWEDFGLKVTTWHASLTGDEGKRAVATFAQFMALYPSLLDEMVEIKKSWDEADKVRVEEAAIAKANEFKEGKEEWGGDDEADGGGDECGVVAREDALTCGLYDA